MSGQNFFSLFDKLIVRLTDEITLNKIVRIPKMSVVNYKELNLNKIWLRPLQILLLSVALYTT